MNYARFFLFLTLLSGMPLRASEDGSDNADDDFTSVKSGSSSCSSTTASFQTAWGDSSTENSLVAIRDGSEHSDTVSHTDSDKTLQLEGDEEEQEEQEEKKNIVPSGNTTAVAASDEPTTELTVDVVARYEAAQGASESRIEQWVGAVRAGIAERGTHARTWVQDTLQAQQPRLKRLAENMFTFKWRTRIRSAFKNWLLFRAHEDFASYFKEGVRDNDLKTIMQLLQEEIPGSNQLLENGLLSFEQYRTEAAPVKLHIEDGVEVPSTTFSHDETRVVLACQKTLHLFSTATGDLVQKIVLTCKDAITALAFSPDDKVLCVAAGNVVYFYAVEKRDGEHGQPALFVKTKAAGQADAEPVIEDPLQTKKFSFVGAETKQYENLSICALNVQEKRSKEFNLFLIKAHLKGETLSQKARIKILGSKDDKPVLEEGDTVAVDMVVHCQCSCGNKNQGMIAALEVFGFLDNGSLLVEDERIQKINLHMATGYRYDADRNETTEQQYLYDFYTNNGKMGWSIQTGVPSCSFFLNKDNIAQTKTVALCQPEAGKTIVACSSKGSLLLVQTGTEWNVFEVKKGEASSVRLFYQWGQEIKESEAAARLHKIQNFFDALFILKKGTRISPISVQPSKETDATVRVEELKTFLDYVPFYIKAFVQDAQLYVVERNRPKETIRELIMAGRWLDKRVIMTITTILIFLKRYHIWNKEGRAKLFKDLVRLITLGFYQPRRLTWNQ